MLSGAEMVVRYLSDKGVKYVYGYPGGSLLHIYDALFKQEKVQHVLVRHEQAATHMADGYARATGKPGVVLVTSGPGSTNAITGIATAYMDSIPMIVLAGQVMTNQIGEDAFQETDMIGVTQPIVKHSLTVRSSEEIPVVLEKAFFIASSGRPGPVVVVIPKDMTLPDERAEYCIPNNLSMRSYKPKTEGHLGQIKKAVDLLRQSTRPVILTGGGVITAEASAILTEFARHLGLPVASTLMGLGGYPGQDEQYLGMIGLHGGYTANMAMHHSDLILNIGSRLDDRITNATDKFCPTARIIHVDIDPASISKTIRADVPIVGSAEYVLTEMLRLIRKNTDSVNGEELIPWWQEIKAWRERQRTYEYQSHSDEQIKPQQVIDALYRVTKGDAYICSDVGQHQMFTAQHYFFDKPRRWINSGGLGTMGFGLPAAMGVQINLPNETVVCVTGDGSIQMNIQELSTCLEYNLPIKIICLNNQSLGMVRQLQDLNYNGRHSQSYMESLPNFVKVVEAYNHVGLEVSKPEELDQVLEKAFAIEDKLVFVNIYVDPEEHVHPTQIPRGSMRDMWVSKTVRT
ncbi:acetolactate synthase 3 large subunit [Amphritea opalescens]|uniref:Acetolactate synthase n=1 Tax=Amphritea opalescens TaxID=2490544 RepID=A0A430KTV4_9GAMM|nr:acetolactate synthase 3 large subunit [Amphritea opalescens]RTE66753.1 acetolactate synthase 3 large subunit [Amphritea opalescens]